MWVKAQGASWACHSVKGQQVSATEGGHTLRSEGVAFCREGQLSSKRFSSKSP